jgi:hypothetical protein
MLEHLSLLNHAAGHINLRPASHGAAHQLYVALLKRVQSPPEPDDQGVLASCTAGPHKPAGGATTTTLKESHESTD